MDGLYGSETMDIKVTLTDEDGKLVDSFSIYQDGSDSEGCETIRELIGAAFTIEDEAGELLEDDEDFEPYENDEDDGQPTEADEWRDYGDEDEEGQVMDSERADDLNGIEYFTR